MATNDGPSLAKRGVSNQGSTERHTMKRTVALLALALASGCAVSPPRVNNQPRSLLFPPMPPSSGRVKSGVMPGEPRSVNVYWTVDAAMRDVLETCPDLSAPVWSDTAGPYDALDIDGVMTYRVPVTGYGGPNAFFRIRRWWGNPWVTTPKTESKTETEK